MEKQQLLQTLEELRAELLLAKSVDPETLAQLEQLTKDIQRAVHQGDRDLEAAVEPDSSGLKDLLLKFEAEHPQLSASIGRVADALAAMGF
jgi:hypothetical protein